MLEDEETRITSLKNEIEAGFASGMAKKFNAKKQLEKLKSAKRKNG